MRWARDTVYTVRRYARNKRLRTPVHTSRLDNIFGEPTTNRIVWLRDLKHQLIVKIKLKVNNLVAILRQRRVCMDSCSYNYVPYVIVSRYPAANRRYSGY